MEPDHRALKGQSGLRALLRGALPRNRRPPYAQGFDLKLWPERLEISLRWRRARLIIVNPMSDGSASAYEASAANRRS